MLKLNLFCAKICLNVLRNGEKMHKQMGHKGLSSQKAKKKGDFCEFPENPWRLTSTLGQSITRNWSTWFWIRCTPELGVPERFSPGTISQKNLIQAGTVCLSTKRSYVLFMWQQAAYRGTLQRRRSASGGDGAWLFDRLRSEHVTAGAPHDLQWRLWGGRLWTVWPPGILWVVSWPQLKMDPRGEVFNVFNLTIFHPTARLFFSNEIKWKNINALEWILHNSTSSQKGANWS